MEVKLRDNQEEIINLIVESFKTNKVVVLNAPTGVGKSIINTVVTKKIGSGYTTTPLRTLVEQYRETILKFEESELGWVVMGRGGYPCPHLRKNEEIRFSRLSPEEQMSQEYKYKYRIENMTADGAPCTEDNPKYFVGEGNGTAGKKKQYVRECPFIASCPYIIDRTRAMESPNAISTMDYFMHGIYRQLKEGIFKNWGERNILVIDEAHFLSEKLVDFFSISISEKAFPGFNYKLLIENINNAKKSMQPTDKIASLVANEFRKLFDPYIEMQRQEMEYFETIFDEESSDIVEVDYKGKKIPIEDAIQKQRKFLYRLQFVRQSVRDDVEFVFYSDNDGLYLKPYTAQAFVKDLWNMFDYILLSSATFFDVPSYLSDLGLANEKWKLIDVPSPFNPENGPIMKASDLHLSKKNFDSTIDQVVQKIDEILDQHPNERGMIHCYSRAYKNAIWERTQRRERMVTHESNNRSEVLRNFTTDVPEGDNSVLLSMNMGEGVSLDDDLARFQIIVKAPFLPLGDPWIALHKERSPNWYRNQTIITLMQMAGRIVRSKEDFGFTYILDGNAWDLLEYNKNKLPSWFSEKMDAGKRLRKQRLQKEMDELLE